MIIFKQLKWSNFFSYGKDNVLDFTSSPVTQLVGLNGVGKTSIALILQELLFGKNVKKIIKANLSNRNIKESISAELTFSIDNAEYVVKMNRGSKLTVSVLKDGEDISSHTAPATLKTIENILNVDFDTFSQLVYQSSKSNLQFLTATDTQRKKFLINLFNLEKYVEIFETLKEGLVEANKEVSEIKGKYSVYQDWLNQHKNEDLTIKELLIVPSISKESIDRLAELQTIKNEAININKKINTNNLYKSQLATIDANLLSKSLNNPKGIKELENEKISLQTLIAEKRKIIKKIDGLSPICHVCKQPIDIADSIKLAEISEEEIVVFNEKINGITTQLKILKNLAEEDFKIKTAIEEFEKLSNLIDNKVSSDLVDVEEVKREIEEIEENLKITQININKIQTENETIAAHNSKVKIHKEQIKEYSAKLLVELNKMEELFEIISQLEILKDAFSTNGLVSYKLEFLVKDLELVINEYLQELSRGRFQLNFILKGDKLNIEISDNGDIITINELSEGELSKVNVSTLLAIRKLMQNLSNTKLNLLFLDEIMGVLDNFGREDLIRVLLLEDSLNTFLVTHEYTHPLVPVLNIVQENNISRIENG